jgi:hypothetical protein
MAGVIGPEIFGSLLKSRSLFLVSVLLVVLDAGAKKILESHYIVNFCFAIRE